MASAKNQHYLPAFLLRRFASRSSGDKVYVHVFRRDGSRFETNVRNVGAELYFYSRERAREIEAFLSQHEDVFASLLARLPRSGALPEADWPICAGLAAQLFIRTRNLREGMTAAGRALVPRALQAALMEARDDPRLLRTAREAMAESGLPANVFPGPNELLEAFFADPDVASEIANFQEAVLGGLANQVPETVRAVQAEILEDGHLRRASTLEPLRWSTFPVDDGCLVLGDVGAVALSRQRQYKPGYAFQASDDFALLLPVSPDSILIGAVDEVRGVDSCDRLNVNLASLSRDFFVSSRSTEAEEQVQRVIGRAADYLVAEVQSAIDS